MAYSPVDFYTRLTQSLINQRGEKFLADLLHRAPPVERESAIPDISHFLSRFSPAEISRASEASAANADFFARLFAAVDRRQTQITATVAAFAARDGICGAAPQCSLCELKKHCDFFNAPPQKSKAPPLVERLAQQLELTDAEYLALLIGGASPKDRDYEIARNALAHCGSLRDVMCAGVNELQHLRTMTANAAARLAAASAVVQKLAAARSVLRPPMREPEDFFHFYQGFFRAQKEENFLVVLLNQKHAVLRDDLVIKGALSQFMLTPREIFASAIRENAAAVALLHNHPSGDSSPSAADKTATAALAAAAKILGIRLIDHLIIGDGNFYSFAAHGLLA